MSFSHRTNGRQDAEATRTAVGTWADTQAKYDEHQPEAVRVGHQQQIATIVRAVDEMTDAFPDAHFTVEGWGHANADGQQIGNVGLRIEYGPPTPPKA